MALIPRARLGPYEILALLGSGGMGEVYRARDTRLNRTAAIKVLPEDLKDDVRLLERFEREAQAIAALTHPNICTVFDVSRANGISFLVMEHLEGETLAARLEKGALPLTRALTIAIEIAGALECAHGHGIVHRDLKPANVMLTKAGAKLLDFGLAKAATAQPFGPGDAMSTKHALTTAGKVLGTLQYMAPEQLESKPADARSDIFAFGVIVYEMLAGRRAFAATSQAALIGAIMQVEHAPLISVVPNLPIDLARIVEKCLSRDPDARWQHAHDLATALRWVQEDCGLPVARTVRARRGWRWLALAGLCVILAALLVSPQLMRGDTIGGRSPQAAGPIGFSISPPDQTSFPVRGAELALSPNGRQVAFVARAADDRTSIWIRELGSMAPRAVARTAGASRPFWSPDGRSLGFFAGGKLKRVSADGDSLQTLADAPNPAGGSWNREGTIIFAAMGGRPIYRISSDGGDAVPVRASDPRGNRAAPAQRYPVFLPDGRRFLYTESTAGGAPALRVGSLSGDPPSAPVLTLASNAQFAPPGYLVFVREQSLVAQAFDLTTLAVSGPAVQLAAQIDRSGVGDYGAFSVSDTGVLVYRSGDAPQSQLIWFSRAGTSLGAVGPPGEYHHPALSPDGTRVAIERGSADRWHSLWVIDLPRDTMSRLTFDSDHNPIWSPDGRTIVFNSARHGGGLYRIPADAPGQDELLGTMSVPQAWSPDGGTIVLQNRSKDLVLLSLASKDVRPLIGSPSVEMQAQISPDGRRLAYSANDSGTFEVYLAEFPSGRGRKLVSTSGGLQPQWRQDGRELFYLTAGGTLMAVAVSETLTGTPIKLFDTPVTALLADRRNHYVVGSTGARFLFNVSVDRNPDTPLSVVVDWLALVRK